jgi:phosphomannomutase/phosphoglucomutase
VVAQVTDYFRQQAKVIDIDGARVLFDGGWGLVRASNTQPALVLRFEAVSQKRLAEIRAIVESALEKIKQQVGE